MHRRALVELIKTYPGAKNIAFVTDCAFRWSPYFDDTAAASPVH